MTANSSFIMYGNRRRQSSPMPMINSDDDRNSNGSTDCTVAAAFSMSALRLSKAYRPYSEMSSSTTSIKNRCHSALRPPVRERL